MGYTTGQKISLSGVKTYLSSDAASDTGKKQTGTFYIWSGTVKNGRIRICKTKASCGRKPAEKYVLCWVNTSAIGTRAEMRKKEQTVYMKKGTREQTAYMTKGTYYQTTYMQKGAESQSVYMKKGSGSKKGTKKSKKTATAKPGMVGSLGDMSFIVTGKKIRTFDDFTWTMEAEIAEHDRHMKSPKLEFTGMKAGKISFEIVLSANLGIKPEKTRAKLYSYLKKGKAVPLRLGKKTYGNLWVIEKLKYSGERFFREYGFSAATLQVSLIHSPKE